MSSDGLSIAPGSTPALLLQPALAWERGVVENPSLAVIDGTYWLLYSAAAWDSANYRMGAARCSGPLGPCNRVGTDPLFGNTSSELGPGGGSFFTDVAGRTRIAHHVWNSPHTSYPSDPNCDRAGLCASQGQRYLRIDGVLSSSGTLTSNAIGSLDTVVSAGGQILVEGWAVDPSLGSSSTVHVYVDGVGRSVLADKARGDIAAVFPGQGASHGYSVLIPASFGVHEVCAYAINVGGGLNNSLGCRSVTVAAGSPFGSFDVVSGGAGSVSVSGWAIDPESAGPIPVHVYIYTSFTDRAGYVLTANQGRADIGAAFPGYGPGHGFSGTVPSSPGVRIACVFAINVGVGDHTVLGCKFVTVS
jgi:hypothetical protein